MRPPKIIVDQKQLYRHVEFLTEIKPARAFNNSDSLKKAEVYIESEFKKIGLKTEKQVFTAREKPKSTEMEYCNIIGTLNPGTSEIIVIGAHYDVCDDKPGADDNASGVAGLIELAGILKKYEELIPYQIQFVAYANEEPPFFDTEFMGSFVHAKSLSKAKANLKFMIALEMIGYFSNKKNSQSYPLPIFKLWYPSVGNFIAIASDLASWNINSGLQDAINKNSKIKCVSLKAPSLIKALALSDHRNYWKFGYKALMVTDTAFFRNDHYHYRSDTIDTLDFKKMAEVVKGIAYYFLNLR